MAPTASAPIAIPGNSRYSSLMTVAIASGRPMTTAYAPRGIEPNRLTAAGVGSTKPLVPANQKGSAALNDRIELIILERK